MFVDFGKLYTRINMLSRRMSQSLRLSLPGGGFLFLYGFVRRRRQRRRRAWPPAYPYPVTCDIYKTAF